MTRGVWPASVVLMHTAPAAIQKKIDAAWDLAVKVGHERVQTDRAHEIYYSDDPGFRSRHRYLSPHDMAQELEPRFRSKLLTLVRYGFISKQAASKLRWCGLLEYGGERGRTCLWRVPLTTYGRAVVLCMGACLHDEEDI